MIIKNISRYFYVSKITYIFILLSIFMGSFHLLMFVSFLLIVHELGHFLTAKIQGVEVDKIYIYPFGGISKLHIPFNYSIFKEFIILLNGPLFQHLAYLILIYFFEKYYLMIKTYHYSMLFFNMLPIYPLDGGKLLNLLFSLIHPYKKSFKLSILISYIIIFLIFLINMNNIKLNLIIIVSFLIYKVLIESKKINFIYENFLLERYINKYHFNDCKMIDNTNNFYKSKRHLIKIGGQYTLENEYLNKKYKKS